jgi:hypothetical protein
MELAHQGVDRSIRRPLPEGGEQTRLPDPGVADDLDESTATSGCLVEHLLERGELGLPPDQGELARDPPSRDPRTGPTVEATTGWLFPLTMNGSSCAVSKRVREWSSTSCVARSSPGLERLITRAARFTASPITVYARRYRGPTSPAKTGPVWTPILSGSGGDPSMTSRSASNMRSSSFPPEVGAPDASRILPPPASMSVPRKVTP